MKCGSVRAREIETMLMRTNIEMLERTKDLTRFMELRGRIHRLGTEDYYTRMNQVFKENWLSTLEKYSHYDNYEKVINLVKKYKKPEDFYEFVRKSELGMDFLYQSDEYYTQQEFNKFARDLGVTDSELIDSSSR